MKSMKLVLSAATLFAGSMGLLAAPASAAVTTVNAQRFCVPTAVIVDDLQKPVLDIAVVRAPVLALTLKRTAKAAPKTVGRSMRDMASMYTALGHAATDADRSKVAYSRAARFSAAVKTVVAYYSTHCVHGPPTPKLPVVDGANQAACTADLGVLQTAEMEYSTLNGGYATMTQLVAAGLLRTPSALHPEITVGNPAGGYTVVGGQGCNDVPTAG